MTTVDLEFDQLNSTVDALRRSISNRLMYGVGKDAVIELKDHVKARVGAWKYPRWIEVVDDLPKTATGKIQRFKLR